MSETRVKTATTARTGVHGSFGGRANGNGFLKVRLSSGRLLTRVERVEGMRNVRSRNPCDFGRETLDVILFALKNALRDKHGEVGVLDAEFLNLLVEPVYKQPC